MATPSLDLIYDVVQKRFCKTPDGGSISLAEVFKGVGCKAPVNLSFVHKKGKAAFPADLGIPDNLELTLARKDTCPQKGTFTLTIAGQESQPLDPNITGTGLAQCFNELLGAGTVRGGYPSCEKNPLSASSKDCKCDDGAGPGCPASWLICSEEPGFAPNIVADTEKLFPNFSADIKINEGSATKCWSAIITLREDAVARISTSGWTKQDDTEFLVTTVTEGGSGTNEVQEITMEPAPLGGHWCVITDCGTTSPISVTATAAEVEKVLNSCGGDRFSVTGECGRWQITFLESTANQAPLEVVPKGIINPCTYMGTLELETDGLCYLLAGCECVDLEAGVVFENSAACIYPAETVKICRSALRGLGPTADVPVTDDGHDCCHKVIDRGGDTENVAPTASEFPDAGQGDTAQICLDGVVEHWEYDAGWQLVTSKPTAPVIVDTHGLIGPAGDNVGSQALLDAIIPCLYEIKTVEWTSSIGEQEFTVAIPAGCTIADVCGQPEWEVLDPTAASFNIDDWGDDGAGGILVHYEGQETVAAGHRGEFKFRKAKV